MPGFGVGSNAVFEVTPGGVVTVILDASGDGFRGICWTVRTRPQWTPTTMYS